MLSHPVCFLALPLLLVPGLLAAEARGTQEATSRVRAHLRESILTHLPPKPAPTAPSPADDPSGDTVKLAPFVVKEIPFPSNAAIDGKIAQQKALEQPALFKTSRFNILEPPVGGRIRGTAGVRRAEVVILRLKW